MLRSTACLTCVVRPAETGMLVRGDTINGLGKYRRSTVSNASGTKKQSADEIEAEIRSKMG